MRLWSGAAVLVLLAGCGSAGGGPDLTPYRWPPESPRVALERLIETRRDAGARGAAFRQTGLWLTGGKDQPLFQRPYGVAWDGEDLLVTDPAAGRVVRLAAPRGLTASPEGLLQAPIGIAACVAGVAASDPPSGRVALLGRDLSLVRWLAEDLERPTGVACGAGGVYVVETGRHRLLFLGDDGTRRVIGRRGEAPGELNYPAALAADGGALWVGDTLNFRLQKLDPEGRPLASFGGLGDAAGETPRIKGVAVDRIGRLWVTDAYLDQVALYDATGGFLIGIGGTGDDPEGFVFPAGVAAHPDGRVAVVDSLNRRIKIFRLLEDGG